MSVHVIDYTQFITIFVQLATAAMNLPTHFLPINAQLISYQNSYYKFPPRHAQYTSPHFQTTC